MTDIRDYTYESVLKTYINDYVSEKRSLGFIYNTTAYMLKRFDKYWIDSGYEDMCITAERLDKWICCMPGESKSSHSGRICAIRNLAIYMNSRGKDCYVPVLTVGGDHNTVHVLSKLEIQELFDVIDNYIPKSLQPADWRMANEYPVMFRLYYCCGMRNNEVCALETADFDADAGIITIRDGKNQKDRLVYLADDMRLLMKNYLMYITKELGYEPFWIFPGRFPNRHVTKSQIDKKFSIFWNATEVSVNCDKKPTPHCFRHTYVVNRINSWILDEADVNVLFPYLSKYLGHKDPGETFYYYHLVEDAFRIIRQKDTMADRIIPEVRRR
jgi:integrase/recombinase XerD